MSYTKGQLATAALEEIGIASYEFDIDPEQITSAIRRLDGMMADWSSHGITLSYPIDLSEDASPDQPSNIPDWAWEAVTTNLALRLGPSYGKAVSQETKVAAKQGYTTVCGQCLKPRPAQLNMLPKGAGHKSTDYPFTTAPVSEYLTPVDNSFIPPEGELNE